jgi:hypothetical protein
MKTDQKTPNWTTARYGEKTAANHYALEFILTVLFLVLLILTAAAFILLSPLFIIPLTYRS